MGLEELRPLPHPSRQERVELRGATLLLWRPPSPEQLLEALVEAPPDPDDKLPYWADLWPSALALAERLLEMPLGGRSVLELGCGLGLSSLAAAYRGARVQATDWDEDALRYVEESAALNSLQVETRKLDWRDEVELSADLLIGADLLYERRNVPWLIALIGRWRGERVLIADPGRNPAEEFLALMSEGWRATKERRRVQSPLVPRGAFDIDLIELSRRS